MPIVDRKQRKRQFRALWIRSYQPLVLVLNACLQAGLIAGLKKVVHRIDRKVLADLLWNEKRRLPRIVEKQRLACLKPS